MKPKDLLSLGTYCPWRKRPLVPPCTEDLRWKENSLTRTCPERWDPSVRVHSRSFVSALSGWQWALESNWNRRMQEPCCARLPDTPVLCPQPCMSSWAQATEAQAEGAEAEGSPFAGVSRWKNPPHSSHPLFILRLRSEHAFHYSLLTFAFSLLPPELPERFVECDKKENRLTR